MMTRSPFAMPLALQRPGKAGDAVLQLGVGDDVLGAGDRAVVDDGGLLAAAGDDVAVDGVPAGVHLRVGEPFVKGRAVGVQRAGGLRHPVDAAGGGQPEPLRVLSATGRKPAHSSSRSPPADAPLRLWYAMGCRSRNGVTGSGRGNLQNLRVAGANALQSCHETGKIRPRLHAWLRVSQTPHARRVGRAQSAPTVSRNARPASPRWRTCSAGPAR